MRLPGRLKRLVRKIISLSVPPMPVKTGTTVPERLDGPGWHTFYDTVVRNQHSEVKTQEQAYVLVTWVNRAIGSIVESSRRAGLLVYRVRKPELAARGLRPADVGWSRRVKVEGLDLPAVADPMELLLNPLRDWSCGWDELFEQTLGHFLLRGWVGWWCPLGTGKRPVSIRIVPRRAVSRIIVEDGKVTGYQVRRGNEQFIVPAEEFCVLRRWHPESPIEGLSPIEAAMLTADTDRAQTQAARNLARRGGFQQGHLSTDAPDATEEEARKVQASYESKYGGPEETYRTPVLWGGYKWQRTGLSMRELGFLDVRKFNREEIGGLYGVPPVLMGDWSNSYYNSREQSRRFWLDAIEPLLKRFKRFLDSQFLPYWDRNLAADWDTADMAELQEDKLQQAETGARLVEARIMSPNEVRYELFGLAPYAGGDAVLAGLGLMPAGSAPAPKPDDESERRRVAGTPDKSTTDEAYRQLLFRLGRPPTSVKTLEILNTPEALVRWWNLLNSIMQPQAARLGSLVRARVGDWIGAVGSAMRDRATDPTAVLEPSALAASLAERSLPLVRAFYVEAGARAEGVAGAKAVKFDLNVARKAKIEAMVTEWAENTTDSTIEQMAGLITEKLQAGADIVASHDEIIAALKDVLGSEYRCEMAARTIVQGANNNATLDGWGQSQVVDGKRWLAGPLSDRRRPVHQQISNEAKVYGLNEDFVLSDGASGQHPGDSRLGLLHIINCGCVMIAALKALPS